MATNPKGVFSGGFDQKAKELILKLIARTNEGKIDWELVPTGLRANVSGKSGGKIEAFYARTESPFFGGVATREWSVFLVRDETGKELLKVTQPAPAFLTVMSGAETLLPEVDALFALASGKAKTELDKAMKLLDQL